MPMGITMRVGQTLLTDKLIAPCRPRTDGDMGRAQQAVGVLGGQPTGTLQVPCIMATDCS